MTPVQRVAQIFGVVFLLVAIVGFVATGMGNMEADPARAPKALATSPNGFGLVPLGGNDIWLHAALGLVLAVVGFTARETRPPVTSAAA